MYQENREITVLNNPLCLSPIVDRHLCVTARGLCAARSDGRVRTRRRCDGRAADAGRGRTGAVCVCYILYNFNTIATLLL